MDRASDPTRGLVASDVDLRRAGAAFRFAAICWFIHCGSVIAYGVTLYAGVEGLRVDLAPSIAALAAISSASTGAIALGLGLRTLARRSIGFVASSSERGEEAQTQLTIPRTPHRDGWISALLFFFHAVIGLVAILLSLRLSDIAGAIALANLWLLAFGVLTAAGVFGGHFLERFLSLVGIYDDPFHLLRWYAALTIVFSNWLLLAFAFAGGLLGALFVALPFGLCPLVGIAAFRRVYRLGSWLIKMRPGSPVAKFGYGTFGEPMRSETR